MSSTSVLSDVLSALQSIAQTSARLTRRPSSIRESLRRKNSRSSSNSSVNSGSGAGSIVSKKSIKSIKNIFKRHSSEKPKEQQETEKKDDMSRNQRTRNNKRRSTAHPGSNRSSMVVHPPPQPMSITLMAQRDPDAMKKMLEAISETPGGRRSLSRLARTCKALLEPALNMLWRDLDSLTPLIGLFPSALLRRPKKPGLGLAKMPAGDDWKQVLRYGEKVRRLTYEESANNVSTTIFSMLEEHRPRTYILPHLLHLTWRVETPAGLDRCSLFLNPDLQGIVLEIGTRFPQLNAFLADMSSRTRLSTFSFISPTTLPDAFTELLKPQATLDKLSLVAPGALSASVGRWIASLAQLSSLQLDLTGRSMIAVEGFFDELRPRSGDSTPSSVGSTDSGVFSAEEVDFSDIRKSALRLTGDLRSKGSFAKLRNLQLTGEASNIAVFLKHLTSPLTQLELVIEDPPDKADWQDLCAILCEKLPQSLQSMKITATGSSRFTDLIRSTSKAEPILSRLNLGHLTSLPALRRLEIDLPESTIFHALDVAHLGVACPNLEELKLCPVARFPTTAGPPKLTLENLGPLLKACRRLHTLAVAVDAQKGSNEILNSIETASRSLRRLHVGHSWVQDPLLVSILLSHLAPHLESVRWFHERNRPGYIEANDLGWQKVAETLPHIQRVRLMERNAASPPQKVYIPPETAEKGVSARPVTTERGIAVRPQTVESSIQCSPSTTARMVQASTEVASVSIDATPSMAAVGVTASTSTSDQSIDAVPITVSTQVDATAFTLSKSVEALVQSTTESSKTSTFSFPNRVLPSVYDFFCLATSALIFYPLSIPLRILDMSLTKLQREKGEESRGEVEVVDEKGDSFVTFSNNPGSDTVVDTQTLQVRQ